jgi:neutral trehalase
MQKEDIREEIIKYV